MGNFFSGFNVRGFSPSPRKFLDNTYTVCVKHKDGYISEHLKVTNPWKYIARVRKEPDVVSAWIKDE